MEVAKMARRNRIPEENERRAKIRELLQTSNISSMDDMVDIAKKWTGRRQDWSVIHAQMAVFFAERMPC